MNRFAHNFARSYSVGFAPRRLVANAEDGVREDDDGNSDEDRPTETAATKIFNLLGKALANSPTAAANLVREVAREARLAPDAIKAAAAASTKFSSEQRKKIKPCFDRIFQSLRRTEKNENELKDTKKL